MSDLDFYYLPGIILFIIHGRNKRSVTSYMGNKVPAPRFFLGPKLITKSRKGFEIIFIGEAF